MSAKMLLSPFTKNKNAPEGKSEDLQEKSRNLHVNRVDPDSPDAYTIR